MMKSEFETWPATPVEASLEINELTLHPGPAGVASFTKRSSRGRPAIRESGCQMSDNRSQYKVFWADLWHLNSDI
jgi:hypothetical protein